MKDYTEQETIYLSSLSIPTKPTQLLAAGYNLKKLLKHRVKQPQITALVVQSDHLPATTSMFWRSQERRTGCHQVCAATGGNHDDVCHTEFCNSYGPLLDGFTEALSSV